MLCDVLEPLVNVKDKEEIATTLINIMQKLDKSKDFLTEVVLTEVLRLGKLLSELCWNRVQSVHTDLGICLSNVCSMLLNVTYLWYIWMDRLDFFLLA